MFQTIWPVAGLFIFCLNIRVRRWNCTPFLRPASRSRLAFVCLLIISHGRSRGLDQVPQT
jgi:hypothetical protein